MVIFHSYVSLPEGNRFHQPAPSPLQVSAPLPLTTAGIASGLAVHNDTVLVTYTASEVPEARALVT